MGQLVVIGVAPEPADRVRLAELLAGYGSIGLVLVGSIEEARRLLAAEGAPPPRGNGAGVTRLADLAVDSGLLLASRNGHRVGLTPLEHDLLVCLASEPRQTWSHASLHETVWRSRPARGHAHIHSVVKRLRRKLSALGASATIAAVRGIGFRLSDCREADRREADYREGDRREGAPPAPSPE